MANSVYENAISSNLGIPAMSDLNETQLSSREQFQRQSANYGKTHILAKVTDVEEALAGIDLPASGRALDVATGGGHTALYLASLGFEVTASDITPAMLENTAKLAGERGLVVQTALHVAEELPYADASFDIVSCRVAGHHFSDPAAFVCESARVLKPGCTFLVIDGSVPDGEPEAEAWIHQIEKLRDPSHGRVLTPNTWSALCYKAGLTVLKCGTTPFKQPDLEWYFETAATSPENRERVHQLIKDAPASALRVFNLATEGDGKITWWWPRLALVARRP
jgi:ubiquinone/menaquinone biosynthesis C-methylase UbiE